MSEMTRKVLLAKGVSAAVAACLFAVVQGCATQPTQTQSSSDYAASSDSASADSASAENMSAEGSHGAEHHGHHAHKVNPYFRTATSTSEGSVTVEGNTIHYHAVAGMLIVHPKGWNDAAGKSGGDDPSATDSAKEHAAKKKTPEASMFYAAYFTAMRG